MEGANIRLEHVSKRIKNNQILSDVNLEFRAGQVYGIEGTNGSGKTMLMRIIAGLIFPTEGNVYVNKKKMTGKSLSQANIGLLIENPAFLANYTGLENLSILASINNRITKKEICQCLTDVGLEPADRRKYKKYSLGMKQRLGIAAAIMEKPDILILDEPVNALDEEGVNLVSELIKREKERGALVILSCHDRAFLESASDELYQMKAGVLSGLVQRQGEKQK